MTFRQRLLSPELAADLDRLGPEPLALRLVAELGAVETLLHELETIVDVAPAVAAPLLAALHPVAGRELAHDVCDAIELWMWEGVDLAGGLALRRWPQFSRWSAMVLRVRPRVVIDWVQARIGPGLVRLSATNQCVDSAGTSLNLFAGRIVHLTDDTADPLLGAATVEPFPGPGAKWAARLTAGGLLRRSALSADVR
ncbi:MAG: hypothetical protein ACOZQL_12260 [Myxococcota bacterium]